MMRRLIRRCQALLLALVVPPCVAAAPAVERDVAVPMRDGTVLRADLLRPAGDGPAPTLVYRTPYGKTETTDGTLARKAVAAGYAVLVQDVRGRHASEGRFDPYRQEGRDGYDTIEWAAAQPWSNGRVGTFGLSYPGAVQWLAAVESPPHLVAMVPAMTFASPEHFWYAGGVWDGSWLAWTWLNIAPDLRRRLGAPGPATDQAAEAAWAREGDAMRALRPLSAMPAFEGIAPWYYEWMRHGPWDPWWDWADLSGRYARVGAAVLNLSGWHDEMYGPAGAAANFAGLVAARGGDARAARTQLLLGPWTHGTDLATTRVGAREMGPAAALDYDALVLGWMDRWLRGIDNGVDRRAPVRYYAMGAGAWREAEAWPPPAEPLVLHLAGAPRAGGAAGVLQAEKPAASTASFVSDAAHPVRDPHGGAAGGHDFRALSRDPGVLTWETAPLAEDLEIAGAIEAVACLSSDRPDTDLWARVLDVAPDGTAWNLAATGSEVLRASYRARGAVPEPLVPGAVECLRIDTALTAARLPAGHRLRLVLMASFAPNHSHNLHTGESEVSSSRTARATITIHAGGTTPSRLVLPASAPLRAAPAGRPAGA